MRTINEKREATKYCRRKNTLNQQQKVKKMKSCRREEVTLKNKHDKHHRKMGSFCRRNNNTLNQQQKVIKVNSCRRAGKG